MYPTGLDLIPLKDPDAEVQRLVTAHFRASAVVPVVKKEDEAFSIHDGDADMSMRSAMASPTVEVTAGSGASTHSQQSVAFPAHFLCFLPPR